MVRSFQINSIFPHLSVLDNVKIALQARTPLSRRFLASPSVTAVLDDPARAALDAVGLDDERARVAANLPYGKKRSLELAIALSQDPRVLLLDEPTAGMGVEDIDRTVELVKRIAPGRTIVLVEHNLRVVADLCDRVTVMQRGKVLVEGTYDEVRADAARRHRIPGRRDALMLELRDVHAYYGESHILHGMTPARGNRRGRDAGRPQRRRQDDDAAHDHGYPAGAPRRDRRSTERRIAGLPSDRIAKRGLGYVPEERGILSTLSVYENLTLAPIIGDKGWSVARIFDEFPILKERAKAGGTTLSGGEQQMLAIARVLRSGARTVLLDEPTEGLAPVIVERIGELIRAMKADGITVLLVEQNVRFATGVADRHHVVVHGRVVADARERRSDRARERAPRPARRVAAWRRSPSPAPPARSGRRCARTWLAITRSSASTCTTRTSSPTCKTWTRSSARSPDARR